LTRQLIENEKRLIVLDPREEYNNLIIIEDFESFIFFIKKKKEFRISCRFTRDEDIEFLFKAIFDIENVLLVMEECEVFINPGNKSSNFLRLVRYGRHKQIRLIGVARRTAELSRDFRAQVNKVISFKQTEDIDLKKMEELGLKNLDNLISLDYKKNKIPLEGVHYQSIIL
jgi:hypothetical protein